MQRWIARICISGAAVVAACGSLTVVEEARMVNTQSNELSVAVSWLENEAHRIIRASRREMKDGTAGDRNKYQNGAYWATPTGWFVYTLDLVDPALADRTILDLVSHIKTYGACEWIFGETRKLPNYLASAALPLNGIRAMLERRRTSTPPFSRN